MAKVFITRYEEVRAFTTARKALESIADRDWHAYMGPILDKEGRILESKMLPVTADTVAKLITKLNKDGFLSLESGMERMSIDRVEME